MSAIVIMLIGCVLLFIGYVTYGKWLAKQWGVDPKRPTPAHTDEDGVDYVPAKAPVLMGHHFASIAGAGPINGPIQAAIFGWVPVFLWVVLGGIFFGAVHDFSSLFASIRHKGKSIGVVISVNIGTRAKQLFLVFSYLTLLLVVAAFTSIVAGTFASPADAPVPENAATATISILFIFVAVLFGFFVYRKKMPLGISTLVGVALIILCIILGLTFPVINIGKNLWMLLIGVYILVASVTPVWILLQPRDYLNSFLLYGMMIAAFFGILFSNPTVNLPAFTGFYAGGSNYLFPMLFITVACGAISGFHSLVGSGTTAKQLDREDDAKLIGYGGMLIECALAVIALITVGILFTTEMPAGTPPQIFATGIATMLSSVLGESAYATAYAIITLSVSAFALTSLDTATRLARYMLQEFFTGEGEDPASVTGIRKYLINPYVSTLITVILGVWLGMGGYASIWPLFGSANQLLAALALLAVAAWLGNIGKNNKMFIIPMVFMLAATISAMCLTFYNCANKLFVAATGTWGVEGLQLIFIVLLTVLAIVLTIEGVKTLAAKKSVE